ncbi:MAG: acetate kinase [Atopobiaceae bacterium]|nr:acetate kinase [Atopobiaceae bacterium]
MNVLVINAGSSSLKFQLLDVDTREVYAKGNCERIGIEGSFVGYESIAVEGKQKIEAPLPTHKDAMKYVIEIIEATGKDFIGIGHRVVQGGWYFPESKVVTDESLGWVREVAPLAPLHNYAEADAIQVCRELFPDKGNVVVADTSFHYNIPEKAWRYALPRDVVDKLHIRKYGAHGTSHRYIWRAAKEFVGDDMHKLVSCHLGSGASLSAIQDGKDMETTMGLTPLDGLIMGTRCGTIDPATVCYLVREGGYSIDEVDTMMNKQSGLLALSGHSDSRDIEAGVEAGDENCKMALEMFYYRSGQLIMEMAQSMHGFDTIAFSAGIGENSDTMRAGVIKELEWMGVKLDPEKNAIRSGEVREISAADSKIRVLVVPTNEEYMIALDVAELLG